MKSGRRFLIKSIIVSAASPRLMLLIVLMMTKVMKIEKLSVIIRTISFMKDLEQDFGHLATCSNSSGFTTIPILSLTSALAMMLSWVSCARAIAFSFVLRGLHDKHGDSKILDRHI